MMFVLGKLSLFYCWGICCYYSCLLSVYFIYLSCTSTTDDFIPLIRDKQITIICYKLRKILQVIHLTASNKVFLNQWIYYNFKSTFAKVKLSF